MGTSDKSDRDRGARKLVHQLKRHHVQTLERGAAALQWLVLRTLAGDVILDDVLLQCP